jgi:glycosyltransferase involved in cell wall biosynthesis
MKILFLVTKAELGGAQISVLNLAREMNNQGHDITVAFGEGNFLYGELAKDDIKYIKLNNLYRSHNPLKTIKFILEFKKILDKEQFDCLHINSSNALAGALSAKLTKNKLKTIFTFRGLSLVDANYNKNKILSFLYKLYFKFFLLFVDEAVFVSQSNYEYALKIKLIKKASVIHNGIDPEIEFYSHQKSLKLLSKHLQQDFTDKFIIGSIGRHCYAKNYEFLIKVFPAILKINPFAVCVIIGSLGEETRKYEKLIQKYKSQNKIFLTGELNNAGLYIPAFNLFTLVSRYEGMPITIIEALFAGVPVLSSQVGGISEMLSEDTKQLFELNNQNDFLKKFISLSQNAKTRREIKKNNLILAENFDIKKTVKGYLRVYR